MRLEVYDLECLSNLFTYTGYNPKEDKYYQFVICQWRNDADALYEHLMSGEKMLQCGFNNLSYDYPLLHHFLRHCKEFSSGSALAQDLYKKSQEIIEQEFSVISDKNTLIPQIDLYRIFHYNNKARSTSLKDLEIAMNLHNVEEMPIHHTTWCKPGDEDCILSYNKNDVYSTFEFLKIALGKTDNPIYSGKNKIQLRLDLNKMFNLGCLNFPDVKIGEQLMLKLYSDKSGIPIRDIKNLGGSPRKEIHLKDCIPHWVHFETKEFQEIKRKFENTTISNIKGSFSESVIFHGCKMDYGTGGLHSCIKPGVYEADDYWMILDEDIGSLYPSLAIQLGLYPEHLGPIFGKIYDEDIVSVRLAEKKKPKKQRNMVIMEGFKLSANGIYGKSGEESSFLYDPLYTMKTTIGGQMFLSMWTEKLVKAIPEIKFLQHNTDGISYMLPRKDLDKAKAVGEEMTRITGLYIEDNIYTKMVLRDVNNYLAVYENGDVKLKGCFEIDKEFHKDPSMRIVPIALKEYFVNNIPISETIKNHTNIFDFCMRLKTRSDSDGIFRFLNNSGQLEEKKLNRTTRYYLSKNKGSGILFKRFHDGRETGVNIGYSAQLFNDYIEKPTSEYGIDYNFYIAEANKVKDAIIDKQLYLF